MKEGHRSGLVLGPSLLIVSQFPHSVLDCFSLYYPREICSSEDQPSAMWTPASSCDLGSRKGSSPWHSSI